MYIRIYIIFRIFLILQINMIVLSRLQLKISDYTPMHNVAEWALFFLVIFCDVLVIPNFCFFFFK